ncbi:MAG: TraB/GumN family protein, partial [Sphingobacteriales bacterium]|nr:TraB/GumN family protein [Sphingobacteriales bacterium]
KKIVVTLLSFFLAIKFISAQFGPTPKTLLWKISGNGLTKPSYLYGTMHLQDRRIFYFTDSLYYHLEHTDAYAMEIDPDEMVDSIITKIMAYVDTSSKLKDFLSTDEYKTYAKKLEAKLGIPADKITRKKLQEEQQKLIYKFRKEDDMPAAMDLYLFGIAKNQGKHTGGIEDVTDQLNLIDFTGGTIKLKDLFLPDAKIKEALENMIKVYLEQDLDKLNNYLNSMQNEQQRTVLLLKRNVKMARRIDSLAHIRSTFFAIGAGHLPADSGVIDLLKERGFTVTPVLSQKRINPDDYKYTAQKIPWHTITDEKFNTYTIEMPGKPTDLNMNEQQAVMKMYMDLTNTTVYLAGVGPLGERINNIDSIVNSMVDKMARGGKIMERKKITVNGVDGLEIITVGNDLSCRLNAFLNNETVYMTFLGMQKKGNLRFPDADRFFNSLVINKEAKILPPAEDKTWKTLRNEEKGFVIKCPAKLIETKQEQEENSETFYKTLRYSGSDKSHNFNYVVIVRDVKPGSYFHGDSVNVESLRENFDTLSIEPVTVEERKLGDVNQFRFKGVFKESGHPFYMAYMLNGNRSYSLFAFGQHSGTPKMELMAKAFLDSFELVKATPVIWQTQMDSTNLFSAWVPSAFTSRTGEEIQRNSYEFSYIAYDKSTCNSFEIAIEKINPYFWATDDSTYFNELIRNNYVNYTDSIIYLKLNSDISVKGAECVLKNKQDDIVRKLRFVLNGGRLYMLAAYVKETDLADENIQRFFSDFKFTNKESSTVLMPKHQLLFDALLSSDSSTAEKAKQALEAIHFAKKDLPYLHKALFVKYKDDTYGYSSIHRTITGILGKKGDNSTVDYIKANYVSGLKDKEALRLNILDVLAKQKTSYAYSALKELLFATHITSGENYYIQSSLEDSLLLSRSLYPELLKLAADTVLWQMVAGLTEDLLDSNLLSLQDIKPFENDFCKIAFFKAGQLRKANVEYDYNYNYLPLIQLLQQLNTTNSNAALFKFTDSKNMYVKFEATIALLKNKQPVSSTTLLALAADDDYRVQLYSKLEEFKKLNLFPVKYLSQKEISKSELKSIGSEDDDEPVSVIFIGERTTLYEGKLKKFLLYKIAYDNGEGEPVVYLGIAGAYDLKSTKITINANASGLYYDESFNAAKLDTQLKAYLTKLEDYAKENPVQE